MISITKQKIVCTAKYLCNLVFYPWFGYVQQIFDKVICFAAYNKALEDAIAALDKVAFPIDTTDREFL